MSRWLHRWLRVPLRRPLWTGMATVLVVACGVGLWYGLRALRFHRDQAAAEKALAACDFAEAQARLSSCVRLRPGDATVRLRLASVARRDGRLDEAREHLGQYEKLRRGPTPEGALEWALIRAQGGQVKEVVHDLIAHLDIRHPASEQILEALAVGCVQVYRLDEASFWIKELLARYPDNPIGRLLDAQTEETLGHPEQSEEVVRRLVGDYPLFDRARLYLAGLLFKRQSYEEAAGYYEEVNRRRPGDPDALLALARCLVRLGQVDQARPLMRRLEDEHPDHAPAILECGVFALADKRHADAERLLGRAARLSPHDPVVHYHLSICFEQLGRSEESRRHLVKVRQIETDLRRLEKVVEATVKTPSDPGPRLEAGQICLRNGQVAEGLRWLFGILEIIPTHKATHQALADHFESQGDSARAEHHRRLAR